ncbi:YceI family protein [Saccharomonospora sp. NPDC006951]
MSTPDIVIPAPGDYRIDHGNSSITFTTRHLFGLAPVRGTFALREGHIEVTDPVHESSATATIAASSFHTGLSTRDGTVLSAQYLDAERHPDITFTSTALERGDDAWVLRGSLTVRETTSAFDLTITGVSESEGRLRITATGTADRYAFGITAMKGMTGRYLVLTADLVATSR